MIHDATYTRDEYASRIGWGHSPIEYAVDVAMAARVRRLALFHHSLTRDDDSLDGLVEVLAGRACRRRRHAGGLRRGRGPGVDRPGRQRRRRTVVDDTARRLSISDLTPKTVLIVDDAPDVVSVLMRALQNEGLRLLSAEDGQPPWTSRGPSART